MNESPGVEEEKKIRHVDKRKLTRNKEQTEEPNVTRRQDDWTATSAEQPTGPNSMNVTQKERNANKCGKLGHYAKCCRSTRETKTTSQMKKQIVQAKTTGYLIKSTQYNER